MTAEPSPVRNRTAQDVESGRARTPAVWERVGGLLKKGLQVTPQSDIVTSEILQAFDVDIRSHRPQTHNRNGHTRQA